MTPHKQETLCCRLRLQRINLAEADKSEKLLWVQHGRVGATAPVFGHVGLDYMDDNNGMTIYHAVKPDCKVQRGLKIVLVARPMCKTKFAK
mmetsp:Transcript_99089/g.159769  ORF Transcript_99089/g.159769 Transcript_99089/m.159769 type:complete len:91 (+) Transcript_99089:1155-1427(+)